MNKIKEIDKLRQEWNSRSGDSNKLSLSIIASQEASVAYGLYLALEILKETTDCTMVSCCAAYKEGGCTGYPCPGYTYPKTPA